MATCSSNISFLLKSYAMKDTLGYLLVINNFESARQGSKVDVKNISKTFCSLGFKLYDHIVHTDLTDQQMKSLLQKFAQDSCHGSASCAAIVIMSHGHQGGEIEAYRSPPITITKDVLPHFDNGSATGLKGKPKFFFFQTCR